jgi:hypothetical protein
MTGPGCSSGEKTYPVSGTVTFDGKEIESGSITFDAADGGPGSFSAGIRDGKYELRCTAGKKKVSVMAYRPVGDPDAATPNRENYIPTRYNSRTELEADVEPGGRNQFDFPLRPD